MGTSGVIHAVAQMWKCGVILDYSLFHPPKPADQPVSPLHDVFQKMS